MWVDRVTLIDTVIQEPMFLLNAALPWTSEPMWKINEEVERETCSCPSFGIHSHDRNVTSFTPALWPLCLKSAKGTKWHISENSDAKWWKYRVRFDFSNFASFFKLTVKLYVSQILGPLFPYFWKEIKLCNLGQVTLFLCQLPHL